MIFKRLIHLIFPAAKFNRKFIRGLASSIRNKSVLEIGSGIKVKGNYKYSKAQYFESNNEFYYSDVNPSFGHPIIDISSKSAFVNDDQYDVVLCTNVLEHVFDYQTALDNLYKLTKPKGITIITVPTFYPLHDEPHDYWRFTEHSLKRIVQNTGFKIKMFEYSGHRKFPNAYGIVCTKP